MRGKRGTGMTTRQILAAPEGAVFVWCNSHLGYPQDLAARLGRDDLKVVGASWLDPRRVQGYARPVVLDHALELAKEQFDALGILRHRGCL